MAHPTKAHTHNGALAALIVQSGETKSEIARRADLSPAELGDLLSGRRAGRDEAVRQGIADALEVDLEAITCRCEHRQANHTAQPAAPAPEPHRRRAPVPPGQSEGTPYDVIDWALAEVEDILRTA